MLLISFNVLRATYLYPLLVFVLIPACTAQLSLLVPRVTNDTDIKLRTNFLLM